MISFKGIINSKETLASVMRRNSNERAKAKNKLERSPENGDKLELSTQQVESVKTDTQNVQAKTVEIKDIQSELSLQEFEEAIVSKVETKKVDKTSSKDKIASQKAISRKFNEIKENNLLPNEVLYFLAPENNKVKKGEFNAEQVKIINAAYKKLLLFKTISMELEKEAAEYGQPILDQMKQIFGGDEGFGKYLKLRKKEHVSIMDKLVKEFKNNYIKTGVFDMFAMKLFSKPFAFLDKDDKELVKLCIEQGEVELTKKDYQTILNAFKPDVDNYLAQKEYKKNFNNLSRIEKNYIKELQTKKHNNSQKLEKDEAIGWVRDLVGIRLVLPVGDRASIKKVENYLDQAFNKNKLHLTRISNYRSNSVLPYLNANTAKRWSESLPGVELVTSSVKKINGYTTTQMNFEQEFTDKENPVLIECQIRSEEMNYINDVEHYIYDVLQKKDITKGIPELKQFFEASGFEKAVKEVFAPKESEKTTPTKEEKYMAYEHAMFSFIRDSELPSDNFGKMYKPILADFGLGEYESVLSFDALNNMNEKVKIIKERYGKKKP